MWLLIQKYLKNNSKFYQQQSLVNALKFGLLVQVFFFEKKKKKKKKINFEFLNNFNYFLYENLIKDLIREVNICDVGKNVNDFLFDPIGNVIVTGSSDETLKTINCANFEVQ